MITSFQQKLKMPLFLSLVLMLTFTKAESNIPEIKITSMSSFKGEMPMLDWQILGPFYTTYASATHPFNVDHMAAYGTTERDITADRFLKIGEPDSSNHNKDIAKNFNYSSEQGFPIFLSKVFGTEALANSYAACIINSASEQDIAFLSSIDDGVKIWVNNKLYLASDEYDMRRNSNITAIHLKKGKNFVLFKIKNGWGEWAFYTSISSLQYAQQVYFNKKHSDFIVNPVIKDKETLSIEPFDSALADIKKPAIIEIFDCNNKTVLKLKINLKSMNTFPLALREGAYKCKLKIGNDTLEQKFVYGNYKHLFDDINSWIKPLCTNQKQKVNVETLHRRVIYLDSFGIRNNYDKPLYRKMAITLYELESVYLNLRQQKEAFSNVPGWHLRGYVSPIDSHLEKYMLYVPESYQKDRPVPLVVVLPWASGKIMPFAESPHVANIEYIQLVCRLAQKYGYAVLWASSRIYTLPSLNPLFNEATFEAIGEVKKDYNIDPKRIYGYGACGGGLLALAMASRYPSLFAAVGVEGPLLDYTLGEKIDMGYPLEWIKANNLFNHLQNYNQTPLLIINSRNDAKGGDVNISKKLVVEVNKTGGFATFDSANNVVKVMLLDMYSQDEMMTKFFSFFKDRKQEPPLTISFATSQLKYNRAHWLSIESMDSSGKATVNATIKKDNNIEVTTTNIKVYTIDSDQLPRIKKTQKLKIITNGMLSYDDQSWDNKITITRPNENTVPPFIKNHNIEGPINDLFKSRFIVVEGTTGGAYYDKINALSTKAFTQNWTDNYFGSCVSKKDSAISSSDMESNNLILIGTPYTNLIIKQMADKLPLKVNTQSIILNGKIYQGDNLGYTFIYPNPLNPLKYILVMGSNNPEKIISAKDLSYKGWYDYEVYNTINNKPVDSGIFNLQWK